MDNGALPYLADKECTRGVGENERAFVTQETNWPTVIFGLDWNYGIDRSANKVNQFWIQAVNAIFTAMLCLCSIL